MTQKTIPVKFPGKQRKFRVTLQMNAGGVRITNHKPSNLKVATIPQFMQALRNIIC